MDIITTQKVDQRHLHQMSNNSGDTDPTQQTFGQGQGKAYMTLDVADRISEV